MTNYYFEIRSKYIIKKSYGGIPLFISGENYATSCVFRLESGMVPYSSDEMEYSILVLGEDNVARRHSMSYEKTEDGEIYIIWSVGSYVTQNDGILKIQIEVRGDNYLWKSNIYDLDISPSLEEGDIEIPSSVLDNYYTKKETNDKFKDVESSYYTKEETDSSIGEHLKDYSLKVDTDKKADLDNVYTKQDLYTKDEVYNKVEVDTIISSNAGSETIMPDTVYTKNETDELLEDYVKLGDMESSLNKINVDLSEIKQENVDTQSLVGAISDSLASDYYTSGMIDQLIGSISTDIDTDRFAEKSELDNYTLVNNVYDKISVDLKLNSKADTASTYTKSQIDQMVEGIGSGGGSGFMLTSPSGGAKAEFGTSNSLDSVFESGIYSYNGSASAPSNNRGILIVISIANFTLQIAYDIMCQQFKRGYLKGFWSNWS